ncbi:MAG: hypothetical protein HQL52_09810 [Magnetococcales bacterium]|nr:hypothetical protein [Magnetococcales bacterium]
MRLLSNRSSWLPGGLVLLFLLTGCAANNSSTGTIQDEGFELTDLAKTDIDLVVASHRREVMGLLARMMDSLYAHNPEALKKSGYSLAQGSLKRVFGKHHNWRFPDLGDKQGTDAILLSMDNRFQGDRVLAFTVGLGSMLAASYNMKHEFYVLDDLDPQKLYNSARNVEIAMQKLSRAKNDRGRLFLVTNQLKGPFPDLSVERLTGGIVASQDTIARIIAQKTKRNIKQAIQFLMFLPI